MQNDGAFAGQEQPEVAAAAMKAIFADKQKSHRVTLTCQSSKGKTKWVEYEMWPVVDYASKVFPQALLVSSLNVTHQRELESQLESAKEQLQRWDIMQGLLRLHSTVDSVA